MAVKGFRVGTQIALGVGAWGGAGGEANPDRKAVLFGAEFKRSSANPPALRRELLIGRAGHPGSDVSSRRLGRPAEPRCVSSRAPPLRAPKQESGRGGACVGLTPRAGEGRGLRARRRRSHPATQPGGARVPARTSALGRLLSRGMEVG